MGSRVTSPNAINKALRAFRRDRRASAAIEFAFVAPIFFVLLFAIIETAMVFFASQLLETGTHDSARLILTNQALNTGMTQAQFQQDLCNRVKILFTCDGTTTSPLVVSVKVYPANSLIPASDLADPIVAGNFVNTSGYKVPNPGDTVMVRAFYQWPLFVTQLGYNLANLGSGTANPRRLIASTAAYRVEPNGS